MKGNGSIIATGNGFRAFFTHNGNRISKRFATKQDAADWLAINRSSVAMGEFVEPNSITFGQWVLECLRAVKPTAKYSTMKGYKVMAAKAAALANIRLQKLNGVQLQRVIDAEPSPSQRYNLYKFIRWLMNKALKKQLIRKDIMLQVDAPTYTSVKKEVFTREEIARIYKALEHNKYQTFYLLAFATGCRLGELAGLKIQSVHGDYIRIENNICCGKDTTTKTPSSIRNITLPKTIIAMLRREWERNGSVLGGYVFTNKNNAPLSTLTIEKHWKGILKAANVPFRNFHYVRHTHATQLLSNGVPILEVQHRLGHANASTTLNRYGHILIDNKDKVLNAIDEMLPRVVI